MGKYDDIINLPYNGRKNGVRLSLYQRAAQFAPFAALNGHGAAIAETARQNVLKYEELDTLTDEFESC